MRSIAPPFYAAMKHQLKLIEDFNESMLHFFLQIDAQASCVRSYRKTLHDDTNTK